MVCLGGGNGGRNVRLWNSSWYFWGTDRQSYFEPSKGHLVFLYFSLFLSISKQFSHISHKGKIFFLASPKLLLCFAECALLSLHPSFLGWCSLYVTLQFCCFPAFTPHLCLLYHSTMNYPDNRCLHQVMDCFLYPHEPPAVVLRDLLYHKYLYILIYTFIKAQPLFHLFILLQEFTPLVLS